MSDFNEENYVNSDGVTINDTRLAHDLIQMLALMSECLEAAGWNITMSYKAASDKVIEHLTSIYGSSDDDQDDDEQAENENTNPFTQHPNDPMM